MNDRVLKIKSLIYDACRLELSLFEAGKESQEYAACQFVLNNKLIFCREAKQTPKKSAQFVTFWKRSDLGPIAPFTIKDNFDFLVVNVYDQNRLGQFVFPKSILIKRGIVSTSIKEGKRAFRVYPHWDIVESNQAKKTQQWQINYFYEVDKNTDLGKVKLLYSQ